METPENEIVISNLFTFESLVQFPLAAIIESSASANITTLDFLKRYCFEMIDGKYVAKTFTFYYEYVKGGAAKTMKVEIPVISLITMPYYTIETAHFEMGVNVVTWLNDIPRKVAKDGAGANPAKEPARKDNADENPRKLLAMLGPYDATTTKAGTQASASSQYNKVSTNMKVRMEVVSSDLPAGILQLINVSSQGVDGRIANDLRISASPVRLIMHGDDVSLTLKLERRSDGDPAPPGVDELALVPFTITVQSSVGGVDPEREFRKEITVARGDIVGAASYEQVKVLTDAEGEVEVLLHPSGKVSTNGFVTVASPLTSNATIYYRIDHA